MRPSREGDNKEDGQGACIDGSSVVCRIKKRGRRAAARLAAIANNNISSRLRAPSRRVFEAERRTTDEGVQWRTKAKKQEEERKGRRKRQDRKAAAAAGLKVGEILEAFSAGDRSDKGGGIDGGNTSNNPGKKTGTSNAKVTPVRRVQKITKKVSTPPPAAGLGATRKRSADNGVAPTKSAKTRKGSSASKATSTKQRTKEGDVGERQESGRRGPSIKGGGGNGVAAQTCDSTGCTRLATFGVNGVVRYWWVLQSCACLC